MGFVQTNSPTVAALDTLLRSIISNLNHVLSGLMPAIVTRSYNLRPHPHSYVLPEKDELNFIPRALYKSTTKSPGNDKITGEMIKGGGEIVAKELHKIINEAWKEGRTPEEWKKSILVILHKKGNT